jgi:hypothetical protein
MQLNKHISNLTLLLMQLIKIVELQLEELNKLFKKYLKINILHHLMLFKVIQDQTSEEECKD